MPDTKRQKGPKEIFCTSCGESIKKQAEICPHCGVRNKNRTMSHTVKQESNGGQTLHDPSEYTTSVSETWWYGIVGGMASWIVVLLLSGVTGPALEPLVGLLTLLTWIGLPVAAYFDIQYVRANGSWNPNTVVWVLLFALWLINIVAGVVYLYRRHETIGAP